MESTNYQAVRKASTDIKQADYIIVGGGAGLSAAAGIEYSGKRFEDNFAPFIQKYGLKDMYSSGFYPFDTQEERWAYWAKHISVNKFEVPGTQLYKDIYTLIKEKDFFVVTTNVDSQFEKAGVPLDRIFEIQGNYGYLQCAVACHDKLYNNELIVKKLVEQTFDCKVPSQLVPKCPVCGGEMNPHLRINQYFVQDSHWYKQNDAYEDFLSRIEGKNSVFLELGVGFNTPGIIRYPFEKLTYKNEHATLIRFNRDNPKPMKENESKTISFTENMQTVVSLLLE